MNWIFVVCLLAILVIAFFMARCFCQKPVAPVEESPEATPILVHREEPAPVVVVVDDVSRRPSSSSSSSSASSAGSLDGGEVIVEPAMVPPVDTQPEDLDHDKVSVQSSSSSSSSSSNSSSSSSSSNSSAGSKKKT